jgi:hypothetical protein
MTIINDGISKVHLHWGRLITKTYVSVTLAVFTLSPWVATNRIQSPDDTLFAPLISLSHEMSVVFNLPKETR